MQSSGGSVSFTPAGQPAAPQTPLAASVQDMRVDEHGPVWATTTSEASPAAMATTAPVPAPAAETLHATFTPLEATSAPAEVSTTTLTERNAQPKPVRNSKPVPTTRTPDVEDTSHPTVAKATPFSATKVAAARANPLVRPSAVGTFSALKIDRRDEDAGVLA
jgi:hypothetical protein